jgi:hypothetical protein
MSSPVSRWSGALTLGLPGSGLRPGDQLHDRAAWSGLRSRGRADARGRNPPEVDGCLATRPARPLLGNPGDGTPATSVALFVPRPATFALLMIFRATIVGVAVPPGDVAAGQACLLGVPLPSWPQCKQGGDQVQRDSWHVAGFDAMFMGQCQQGCAVRERLNDHHGSRCHDQHEADGKASSASRSALGCSLVHVGRLLQRSPRESSGSTPDGSR